MKFSSDRVFAEAHGIKLGAFGSNAKRFDENKDPKKDVPGPGFYDYNIGITVDTNKQQ